MNKIAVIADIHSNINALHQTEAILKQESVDAVFVCGDLMGYRTEANACCDWLKQRDYFVIAGNHDQAVANDACDLTNYSAEAVAGIMSNREQITPENKLWLSTLPLYHKVSELEFVHASLIEPEAFRYLSLQSAFNNHLYSSVAENINAMTGQVCFVGHSHSPGIYLESRPNVFKKIIPVQAEYHFDTQKIIVDVGSVGLPRNARQNACVVIYYTESHDVVFKRFRLNM